METNIPPATPRRRRAGNVAALPSELPLVVPQDYQHPNTPGAAPATLQPSAAPVSGDVRHAAQVSGTQVPPIPRQPAAAPRQSAQLRYPATDVTPASSPQRTAAVVRSQYGQPVQPRAAQPAPRPVPQSTQGQTNYSGAAPRPVAQSPARSSRPAVERPQAYGEPNLFRRESPAAPRTRQYAQPGASAIMPEMPARRSTLPAWMWSLFAVMLIIVLLLSAFSAIRMAQLKMRARERQQAWENVLYTYHVTEQDNGALRVTWQDHIERYAAMYNLDPAFVTAIIRNESSFRTDATSSVGARGLMQMMPDTAEWIAGKLGEPFDFDHLYEAETSIRYGCWYLNFLSELFQGDTVLVCAAYHAGQGEVLGWLGKPSISADGMTVPIDKIPISNTKIYAGRVTQAYGIYKTLLYSPDPAAAAAVYGADPSLVSIYPDR